MEDKKVIIITGANCGIGLETAKSLCELGHDVIVSVRNDAKGEATVAAIKDEVPNAHVMYIMMELEDPQSIRDFVSKFLALDKPLHVLINNAGLVKSYKGTDRCIARNDPALEITMTVNCMGPFLLTNLLLDKLKETGTESHPARIVNVSSSITIEFKPLLPITKAVPLEFFIDDLMLETHEYRNGKHSYRNSKLALNMWSHVLAEKLKGTGVLVNTMCPGFIPSTDISRDTTSSFRGAVIMRIMDSFIGRYMAGALPVSESKNRMVRMALAEETKTCGIFYVRDKPTAEAEEVRVQENLDKIWELCVKYSGL